MVHSVCADLFHGSIKKIPLMHKNNAVNLRTNVNRLSQRSHKKIVVLLFFSLPLFAGAQTFHVQPKRVDMFPQLGVYHSAYSPNPVISKFVYKSFALNTDFQTMHRIMLQPVSPGYYACTLGFFCRQELKMDRLHFIPLRVRLGSLDYTNRLEGKR
jgi:hypothetical protein